MPFTKLLAVRETRSLGRERGAMFYAQSWFLMHYLMIGREDARFAERTADYLRRAEAGEAQTQAFEAAFGIKPSQLQATLLRYARKLHYYRGRPTTPFEIVEPQVRRMAPDEIAAELGLLALIRDSNEAAEEHYNAALAANPSNALALVGAGDVHKEAGRYDQAVPLYESAIALEPSDANHELDYGEYFLTRASLTEDPAEARSFLVEARRHFARSYKLNPHNPETLDQNGLTYLFEGEDAAKAVESLELAHQLLPSHPSIRANLAKAYVEAGQPEQARAQLRRLLAWSHSEQAEWIQKQLAALGPDPHAPADTDAPEEPPD
jgi:tetratricopeptide (TPR) repeat protein